MARACIFDMAHRGDDGEGRKVFVGGLPFAVDDAMIRDEFGRFGEIEDIYLPRERESGKPRGFGFVTFREGRDADDASRELHG